jgi:hypothetical protein
LRLDGDDIDLALLVGEEAVVEDDRAALDVAHVSAYEALAEIGSAHARILVYCGVPGHSGCSASEVLLGRASTPNAVFETGVDELLAALPTASIRPV